MGVVLPHGRGEEQAPGGAKPLQARRPPCLFRPWQRRAAAPPVQAHGTSKTPHGGCACARRRGIAHCFRASVQEEGYAVLVRGLKACLVRAFLVNAAIFAGYEGAMGAMVRHGLLARQPGDGAAGGLSGVEHHPEQMHKT